MDRKTVREYAHAITVGELRGHRRPRGPRRTPSGKSPEYRNHHAVTSSRRLESIARWVHGHLAWAQQTSRYSLD